MTESWWEDIKSYYVAKNGIKGMFKSPAIMARVQGAEFPIVYLIKPKWMDDFEFKRVVDYITMSVMTTKILPVK